MFNETTLSLISIAETFESCIARGERPLFEEISFRLAQGEQLLFPEVA